MKFNCGDALPNKNVIQLMWLPIFEQYIFITDVPFVELNKMNDYGLQI